MSLTHTLEDAAYCDICHDLRLIKAVGGVLMSAAVSGDDFEDEEIGSLACQVHESAMNIMRIFNEMEEMEAKGRGSGETRAQERTPEPSEAWRLDPITVDNLRKDVKALIGVQETLLQQAGLILSRVEGICHDLDIELPAAIKVKIAQERQATQDA